MGSDISGRKPVKFVNLALNLTLNLTVKALMVGILLGAISACGKSDQDSKAAPSSKSAKKHADTESGKDADALSKSEAVIAAQKYFGKLPYKQVPLRYTPRAAPKKPNVVLLVVDAIEEGM